MYVHIAYLHASMHANIHTFLQACGAPFRLLLFSNIFLIQLFYLQRRPFVELGFWECTQSEGMRREVFAAKVPDRLYIIRPTATLPFDREFEYMELVS